MQDNVNHPTHYVKGKYETIDIIQDVTDNCGFIGFECVCVANILKYLIRCKFKNGIEDLKKTRWYLDKLINCWDVKNGRKIR